MRSRYSGLRKRVGTWCRVGNLEMAIAPEDALGLDEVADALDNGWTLPARWYSDPAVAELEYERIFAHSWTLLCPEAKLAKTGDHVIGNSGRVPVVVTRDAEGE